MKKMFYVAMAVIAGLSGVSCSKSDDPNLGLVTGKLELFKSYTQHYTFQPGQDNASNEIGYQEAYQVTSSGTFVKTRTRNDSIWSASGRYVRDSAGGFKFHYETGANLRESCSGNVIYDYLSQASDSVFVVSNAPCGENILFFKIIK